MFKQIKDLGIEKTIPDNTDIIAFQQADGITGHITRENFLASSSSEIKYIQLIDSRAATTQGGQASAVGSWYPRVINTISHDDTALVTVGSNLFKLPSGNYFIDASAEFNAVGRVRLRLRNSTDNTVLINGASANASQANGVSLSARLSGYFTIANSKNLTIEYRTQATNNANDLGVAASFGVNEIYLIANLWKLS